MITLWGRNNSTNVKKVRWVLEELDLPYQQILAGLEFGLNHDADYLAAQYGQNRLWVESPAERAQGEKWMDWANGSLSPAHRPVLMGLVRTPPEKRDPAAIEAGIAACETLFAILDDELSRHQWLSGNAFGLGDIAVAPFIYNLLEIVKTWQPRPHLQRWYQQINQRQAWRNVVMIPVT